MRLSHIRLLVQDFPGCFRFYRDALGLAPDWGSEEGGYASFVGGVGMHLSLFRRDLMAIAVGASELPAVAAGQDRAVVVFEVADVDAEVTRLQGNGVTITREPQDFPGWGLRAEHLRDPDGNLIELYTLLPQDRWTHDLVREDQESHERYHVPRQAERD